MLITDDKSEFFIKYVINKNIIRKEEVRWK